MAKVRDIYELIDRLASMNTKENDDNCGLLVGNYDDEVTKVLVALDITNEVIQEAKNRGAQLIVSHHPVFNFEYERFYTIGKQTPIYNLAYNGIAAICVHTPLDIAKGGINDIIYDMLKEPFGLGENAEIFIPAQNTDEVGFGKICDVSENISPERAAVMLKDIFGCTVVRYCSGNRPIRKLAFCSGGGGSLVREAIKRDADAYICGDVKHDQWISARNSGISLFDCGHYHTEIIMVKYIVDKIMENIQNVEVYAAESGTDPVQYAL